MTVWFEGESDILCSVQDAERALDDPGRFFTAIVSRMPGMTTVELVEQGAESVTIRTNEGLMHRTNLSRRKEGDRVIVEFDERYEAGSKFTATSHFVQEFIAGPDGVLHHLVMSDVEAPGFLGFFYRKFGSSKMGPAFLTAHKAHLEA